jgi:UDP-N-acetylmuramyl pentapeptide phosphotransferase/UDP-N-acetylglucosamine-1-phosphate transferase
MQHGLIAIVIMLCSFSATFFLLKKWQWFDEPESRSSHRIITLRGLGIAFMPVILLAWVLNYFTGWQCIGILFAGFTGLAADFEWMPPWHRLLLYIIACILFLSGSKWFGLHYWWMPVLLSGLLVWINLFNFMDGINGMMALNSLVSLITFLLLPELKALHGFIVLIIVLIAMYSFFNVRKKAMAFAGDVGSILLSFCIAYPILIAISTSGKWWYLMFFCLYIIDAGFTLILRLIRGYNILKPHRTHLYEYLVNEAGQPHLYIAFLYAVIQLFINLILIGGAVFHLMPIQSLAVLLFIICLCSYFFIRQKIVKQYVIHPVNG